MFTLRNITVMTHNTQLGCNRCISRIVATMIIILVITFCIGGCAVHQFSIDDDNPGSVSVDAKRRLVFVTKQGGPEHNQRVICAEPSPDVFTAIAASAQGDVDMGGQKGDVAMSIAQSASSFGQRTQTIQLLRDGLYRACEAYMNGALGKKEYNELLHGYDELMITLMAIDDLNYGAPPIISGSAQQIASVKKDTQPVKATILNQAVADGGDAGSRQQIVRNYYCFQLILKKGFYPESFKDVSDNLISTQCRSD